MKPSKRIAIFLALALIVGGLAISVGAMIAMGFDFTAMNTLDSVTNTYAVEEPFTSIVVDGAECAVRLLPADDGVCKVVCSESAQIAHTVSVSDHTLYIQRHDRRQWYAHMGIYWGSMEITIYLPQSTYQALYIKTLSGNITIPADFSFEAATLLSTSGSIHVSTPTTHTLSAETVSGNLQLSNLRGHTVSAHTISGGITLSNVRATAQIQIESVSGKVTLTQCDANSLWIKTVSGSVYGTLLSPKQFLTTTTSGRVHVPSGASNGTCEVKTTSGNITFEITE